MSMEPANRSAPVIDYEKAVRAFRKRPRATHGILTWMLSRGDHAEKLTKAAERIDSKKKKPKQS